MFQLGINRVCLQYDWGVQTRRKLLWHTYEGYLCCLRLLCEPADELQRVLNHVRHRLVLLPLLAVRQLRHLRLQFRSQLFTYSPERPANNRDTNSVLDAEGRPHDSPQILTPRQTLRGYFQKSCRHPRTAYYSLWRHTIDVTRKTRGLSRFCIKTH